MRKAGVSVTLRDVAGNVVSDARVELGGQPLSFDERLGAFVSEPVEPGQSTLAVYAEGFESHEVSLRLTAPGLSTSLILGRPGQPYYMAGGRRVYFNPAERPSGAMAETLGDALPMESPARQGRFLTRFIDVIVEKGVTRERLEEVIRPFGLRVFSQDRLDLTIFKLESEDVPGPELGALPERLARLPEIRSAMSVISAPIEDAQFVPNDTLFPLQFHAWLTRLPEAWERVDPAKNATSFGSADVIVAVNDSGIATTIPPGAPPGASPGTVARAVHPEFAGQVTGGTFAAHQRKLIFAFDFSVSPISAAAITPANQHGSCVAGIISAAFDATGVVGAAANTRLAIYVHLNVLDDRVANAFAFYAGLDPGWQQGGLYTATEPFPFQFGTGANNVPGADIVNASHNLAGGAFSPIFLRSFQQMTLFGRNRRGTLLFAAAGNLDVDLRESTWGENTNAMRVGASTLDLHEEELRANYSAFSLVDDRVLDFSAPSSSVNVAVSLNDVPRMFPFVTTHLDLLNTVGAGKLTSGTLLRTNLTNSPAAGTRDLQASAAVVSGFSPNMPVLVRDRTNLHAELHVVDTAAGITLRVQRDLGFSYTAANGELVVPTNPLSCTFNFGGTSAATPVVSGIAALMLSVRPELTWLEVRDILRSTAVPIALRYRGSRTFIGPPHRYRWLDHNGADLLDADGLLAISGGNRTITAGPVTRGARILQLNSTTDIEPRQALMIGAETTLSGAHPKPAPNANQIDVARSDEFANGDTIFIGRDVETVLIAVALQNSSVLWVQSVDGIEPGDSVTVGTGATAETMEVRAILRMTTAPIPPVGGFSDDAQCGLDLTASLNNFHNQLQSVRLARREGPFIVLSKSGNTLRLNNAVQQQHPSGRMVSKRGTELRAVIRVHPGNRVEIDRLQFDHPFNAAGVEHVRLGGIAAYSLGLGYGRVDALEAVEAARNYSHDDRDLVIRNFLADDGVTNVGAQEVESPDLWVRNDEPTDFVDLPDYADPGPHQVPEVTIDPAIHIGTGRNDLEVSGTCTSAAEVTFTIEIDGTGPDTFKFRKDNDPPTTNVAITPATAQALSDGVSIQFAAAGHVPGDRWIVRARQIVTRFLHVRTRNRGRLPYFERSTFAPATSPDILEVAQSRLLLCVTDGFPVCRFASIAAAPGTDDVQVISTYSGANARALYTIEITNAAGGGDTFRWHRDGAPVATVTLTPTTLDQTLNDGVQVRFGSHTGHAAGDRWNIYARSGADAFLNLDHYWEQNSAVPFNPSSGRVGSTVFTNAPISGLAAGDFQIDVAGWPEPSRFPTNNPNLPKPTIRRRLFLLGEVVPHDGALTGFTPKTNNNISLRELVFAKVRFSTNGGADALPQIDVDHVGLQTTKPLRVEVRCTAGMFTTERVRVRFTARKGTGPEEVRTFRFSGGPGGTWDWDAGAPTWATATAPLEARRPDGSQPAAVGEQFDIQFDCTLTVDKTISAIVVDAEIVSDFRDLVIFRATHNIPIIVLAPLPSGTGAAAAATQPKPSSFVFADFGSLTQSAQQAFGPVDGSPTTRYRTTALFRSTADVRAFAPVNSFVALQRDPANNDTVNLILRPVNQPLGGFTPIKYFIYRGLRLTDFLKGTSGAAASQMQPAGTTPFLSAVWNFFAIQNPTVTEMPSSLFGFDPATQTPADKLDDIFFRIGAPMQLPMATRGIELGKFHNAGGSADFGFEIVVEEGDFRPDLAYARKASNEIDISSMPNGTAAEKFARRLKQEEILNYLDPAAFYGLHMHEGGKVDDAPPNVTHVGQAIFTELVAKFFTKNNLYLDIRSDNGSSLNFHRNYDDGSGNQVQTGTETAPTTPRPYATHGWPIVILDNSAPAATGGNFNLLFVQFPRKDNEKPVLFVDHGRLRSKATDGRFVRDAQLHPGTGQWTNAIQFDFPNVGPPFPLSGVAWVIRLFYGRLQNPTPTVPLPNTVLKTAKYLDNVFGPVDRSPTWAGAAAIKWITTQDNRYVDADSDKGWRQMMQCGLAEQTGATPRVLLYALATARDTTSFTDFTPIRGVSNGISSRPSFFTEAGLFGVYQLEQDQIDDAGVTVRTLQLRQRPVDGYSPTSALLLGLTKVEFDALVARGPNLSAGYLRTLLLDDKQSKTDPNGRPYDTFRVGIQGLNTAFGEYESDFPADEIRVYSVDGQLFASKDFAAAEPLPTSYARSYEEAMGVRIWPQRERVITAVDVAAKSITIPSFDWRREVFPGGKLRIDKSAAHNGEYTVGTVTFTAAGDTVIVFSAGPGLSTNPPLGSAFTLQRPVEDMFIDLDQDPPVTGIAKTRTLVDGFVTDLAAIVNDAAAKAAIETKINDVAPKLLTRARSRAVGAHGQSEDHERTLYWARLRMLVALKSHPFCLSSLSMRDALIAIFEKKSRGYDLTFSAAPAGAKKVLITGFDPFQLDLDIETSNPSAAIALALHGQTVTSVGRDAYMEAAIFPVRYRDFDAGLVEALVNPRLDGPGKVDMIVTISQNGGEAFFDLERLAGRRRGGFPDNDRVTTGPQQLGQNATHDAFYETTLPAVSIVQGPFSTPPDPAQQLFFDQSYETVNPQQIGKHPTEGGPNNNAPAFALSTITGQAAQGSGGDYLSNEIFYRVCHRRQKGFAAPVIIQSGHFHVPSPKNANKQIADVITAVEDLIKSTL